MQSTETKTGRARALLGAFINWLIDKTFAGKPPAPCQDCGGGGCEQCAWLGSECPNES